MMKLNLPLHCWLLLLPPLAGCRIEHVPPAREVPPPPAPGERGALHIVREPTVVAFWLPASDTLDRGHAPDVLDDFRYYTGQVAGFLDGAGITLVATNTDTIVVDREGAPSRRIMLSGLDYPFGYVLVDPGYPEEILTGVSTDDDLLDEVESYFGMDDDSTSAGRPTACREVRCRLVRRVSRQAPHGRGRIALPE